MTGAARFVLSRATRAPTLLETPGDDGDDAELELAAMADARTAAR